MSECERSGAGPPHSPKQPPAQPQHQRSVKRKGSEWEILANLEKGVHYTIKPKRLEPVQVLGNKYVLWRMFVGHINGPSKHFSLSNRKFFFLISLSLTFFSETGKECGGRFFKLYFLFQGTKDTCQSVENGRWRVGTSASLSWSREPLHMQKQRQISPEEEHWVRMKSRW